MSEILPIESANLRYSDDEHPTQIIAKYEPTKWLKLHELNSLQL